MFLTPLITHHSVRSTQYAVLSTQVLKYSVLVIMPIKNALQSIQGVVLRKNRASYSRVAGSTV